MSCVLCLVIYVLRAASCKEEDIDQRTLIEKRRLKNVGISNKIELFEQMNL